MNDKEQAKKTLLMLIDACIQHGTIFKNAATVAAMVNAVHVLGADHAPGEVPQMLKRP